MHPALSEVILAFRSAQDLATMTLRERLGISAPRTRLDWMRSCYGMGLEELGRGIGITIRPHGAGVEMILPAITIDFDWGDCGEGYGFDVWRLWNHCSVNRLFLDSMTHDLLKLRFERACGDQELVGDRFLHYLPTERQRFASSITQP